MAAVLAERNAAFQPLRVKIHGSPDASDAAAVRAWAGQRAHAAQRDEALALAAEIDRVHAGMPMAQRLAGASRPLAPVPGRLPSALAEAQQRYAASPARSSGCSCRPRCCCSCATAWSVRRRRSGWPSSTCRWRWSWTTSMPPASCRLRPAGPRDAS